MKTSFDSFIGTVLMVTDTGNYKYNPLHEEVPFPATLVKITDYPCFIVKCLKSGSEFELYHYQIMEFNTDEEIIIFSS